MILHMPLGESPAVRCFVSCCWCWKRFRCLVMWTACALLAKGFFCWTQPCPHACERALLGLCLGMFPPPGVPRAAAQECSQSALQAWTWLQQWQQHGHCTPLVRWSWLHHVIAQMSHVVFAVPVCALQTSPAVGCWNPWCWYWTPSCLWQWAQHAQVCLGCCL
jgi:hypothetical protein